MKFREGRELLLGRRFYLKMKGMVYPSCVRSAMLYGSETWCLRENQMIILRRTERVMVRSIEFVGDNGRFPQNHVIYFKGGSRFNLFGSTNRIISQVLCALLLFLLISEQK